MKQLLALSLCLLALVLPGCGKGEASGEPSSSREESEAYEPGYPVEVGGAELTQPPERVVSLSPALTELACDLGYFDQLAGVSDYCSYDGLDVDGLPRFGTVNAPDVQGILDTKPEVVCSASPLPSAVRLKLQEAGIEVAVLPRAGNPEELAGLYESVGLLYAGAEAGAADGSAFYHEQWARLENLREQMDALGGEPVEACYLRVMPLTLATGDTFESALLEAAGFASSGKEYGEWTYPADKAADLMPDAVFYDRTITPEELAATPVYSTTPAYQNQKCFAYDLELFERQGARMFGLLEQMAADACGIAAGSAPSGADRAPDGDAQEESAAA